MTPAARSRVLGGRFAIGRELRRTAGRALHEGVEVGAGRAVLVESAPERTVAPAALMRLEHARSALPEGIPRLIAPVRAVGRDGEGVHLVTDRPPGTLLSEREGGPMALGDAVAVGRDILNALAELHAHGILHRDLGAAAVGCGTRTRSGRPSPRPASRPTSRWSSRWPTSRPTR